MRSLFTLVTAAVLIASPVPAQQLRQKAKQQKMLPLPAPAVQRFLRMSPEDRERALAQLPPERRQQVEQRLARLQQLPPDQLQGLQDLYPAFTNLRPVRRQAVRQEIQQLRQMRPALRRDRLASDSSSFSPEEMEILRRVTGIPE